MCGFVFIKHFNGNLDKSRAIKLSNEYITNRGPDYCTHYSTNDEFAFQSVLAIQSDIKNPQINLRNDKTSILYNGEIYSDDNGLFQEYNPNLDKIKSFENNDKIFEFLQRVEGMYAICKINKVDGILKSIELARDPSGEKHIFYYLSKNLIVISSVPGFIKEYCILSKINEEVINDYLSRRHLISYKETAIFW